MSRYPLDAARVVRASVRERAERALNEATRALSSAELAAAKAADALGDFRAVERARSASASAPRTGAALQREAAFRARLESQERALIAALQAAAKAEMRAARSAQLARSTLTAAVVDEKVVERHHERWAKGEAKAAERAEERELEEISRT